MTSGGSSRLRIIIDASTEAGRAEMRQMASDLKAAGAAADATSAAQNRLALAMSEAQGAAVRLADAQNALRTNTDPARQAELEQRVLAAQVALDKEASEVDRLTDQLDDLARGTDRAAEGTSALTREQRSASLMLTELYSGLQLAAGALRTIREVGERAFEFAKEGAAIAQTAESFDRLLAKVGANRNLLLQLREASAGTISDLQLMSATATLLAGAQGELATSLAEATPELLEIAKAANKLNPTLGDTTFLYESLATGIKRGSPMILDNLGLTIRLEQANAAYARQLGKTADQLTAEEQKQALLNEVLRAGAVLIDQAGGAAGGAGDGYARFGAATENLTNELKKLAGITAGPLVEAFATKVQTINAAKEALDAGAIGAGEFAYTLFRLLTPAGIFASDELAHLAEKTAAAAEEQARYQASLEAVDPWLQNLRAAHEREAALLAAEQNALRKSWGAWDQWADMIQLAHERYVTSQAAMNTALLEAGLAGNIAGAWEDWQAVVAETTPAIEQLTAEIARYQALHGQTITVTEQGTVSLAEYELAQIKAAVAAQKLAEYTGDSREEQLTLQVAAEGAAERVAKMGEQLGITREFTADYTKKIQEANGSLEALIAKQEGAEQAIREATQEMIFQQAVQGLSEEQALKLAFQMGRIEEQDYLTALSVQNLRDRFDENNDQMITAEENAAAYTNQTLLLDRATQTLIGQMATGKITEEEYIQLMRDLALAAGVSQEELQKVIDKILGMPSEKTITITTKYVTEGQASIPEAEFTDPVGTQPAGPDDVAGAPGTGFHSGADFIVPPGFPNDSFGPLYVESGEHVRVTPAGEADRQAGDVYYITVDARGASDPAAVEAAGYRGAQRALAESGRRADGYIRMGIS